MKELLLVCIGSFFGGGARYLVGKAVQSWVAVSSFPVLDRLPVAFPWGTMAVNVIGCFLIGLLSGLLILTIWGVGMFGRSAICFKNARNTCN